MAHAKRDGDKHALQGVNGKEKKIQGEHRKEDGESGELGGTGSVRETDPQHVEDAGRALRSGSVIKGENEEKAEGENSHNAQRPGEASAADVADATAHGSPDESKRDIGGVEEKGEGEKEARNQPSVRVAARGSAMADAVKRNVEAGRERRRAIREGHQEEGFPGHAAGRGENPWEGWWTAEPDVGRMDHGIPKRVDRLKCLGNSLIPMIPFLIGRSIMEAENA